VRSIDEALGQWRMKHILKPFRCMLSPEIFQRLVSDEHREDAVVEFLEVARSEVAALLDGVLLATEGEAGKGSPRIEGRILTELEAVLELLEHIRKTRKDRREGKGWEFDLEGALGDPVSWMTLVAWVLVRHLGEVGVGCDRHEIARVRMTEWFMDSAFVDLVHDLDRSEADARRAALAVDLMIETVEWRSKIRGLEGIGSALSEIVGDEKGQEYLRVNTYADVLWFQREAFEELLRWMILAWVSDGIVKESEGALENLIAADAVWRTLVTAAERSRFSVAGFTEILNVANDVTASKH
jgi:hypothetical protein